VRVCVGGPQVADKSQFGKAVKELAKETHSDKSYLPFSSAPSFVTNMKLFCLTVVYYMENQIISIYSLIPYLTTLP
jgi:hypothetical protein